MSVDSYIEARATFVRLDKEIDALSQNIMAVGDALRSMTRGMFSFSNTGVGMPAEVTLVRGHPTANGDDWRSAKQIMESLAAWHEARRAVQNEWSQLTPDQQAAMNAPPPGAVKLGRR